MASSISITTIPKGVKNLSYAALTAGKPFLSESGGLHWKVDSNTCFNAVDGTISTGTALPASGYECDVQILARYTRKALGE